MAVTISEDHADTGERRRLARGNGFSHSRNGRSDAFRPARHHVQTGDRAAIGGPSNAKKKAPPEGTTLRLIASRRSKKWVNGVAACLSGGERISPGREQAAGPAAARATTRVGRRPPRQLSPVQHRELRAFSVRARQRPPSHHQVWSSSYRKMVTNGRLCQSVPRACDRRTRFVINSSRHRGGKRNLRRKLGVIASKRRRHGPRQLLEGSSTCSVGL